MNAIQCSAFDSEIALAQNFVAANDLDTAFAHLERAHVMGQLSVMPHITSHWLMLRVEIRRRRFMAIPGQVVRILLGALGSAIGAVPIGNTAGTNVSMFKRMPIDSGLQNIIDGSERTEKVIRPDS